MPFQPAILGLATVGNTPLGYIPVGLTEIRQTRVIVTVAGTIVRYRRGSGPIRDVINDSPNTCRFTLINPDIQPFGQQAIRVTINSDAPRLLFSGALETVSESYVLLPDQLAYDCTAQDDTPKANRRIPLAYYENTPADEVAIDLVDRFVPGCTANHVQSGLPNITVNFEGSEAGVNGCLRQIAKLIGGYFYWEDRDLWLFTDITVLGGDLPDDIDSTPGRLLDDPHITITRDDSQLRTRVYGKGHKEQTTAEVVSGASVIPLGDVSYYNPAGGMVISESQILDYTGTVAGGFGALVGTTVTPTNPPLVAGVTAASGIEVGDHVWAYTFYDGTGETLPSPLSDILDIGSVVTAPSGTVVATEQFDGNLGGGTFQWVTTFADSGGRETTPSPAGSLTMSTLAAPAAMGVTDGYNGGGALDSDVDYSYKMTFYSATKGETTPGPAATFHTVAANGDDSGALAKSGTSAAPSGFVRRFYRTEGGGSTYKLMPGAVLGFEFEDASLWYDEQADGSLGAAAPSTNTAHSHKANLSSIPVSPDTNITTVNIYRTVANGSTFKLAGSVSNGTTTWQDNVADGSLGADAPSSNTAVYRQAALSGIAVGPSGTTGRKVYRTAADAAQLKLLTTIANNSTTTYADSTVDASLGANVPTSDTSGLVTQTGSVAAGSTSLLVTSTGPFVSAGGWAAIGSLPIHYTGFSGSSLTGIPASGVGALTTSVRYGAAIITSPMLTGVSGIVRTLIKGAPIHIWVERNDLDAQAELAARDGSDGIIEHRIVDERRGEASLIALCDADLAQFSRPIVTVTYASRDVKTKSGKPIVIDLPSPQINEELTIQDVTITELDIAPRLNPKFTVTASSVRFSVEDLLRRMAAASLEGQ